MSSSPEIQYDVIIIGAGIAGLVAGNYLAKAGQKVLILEQHFVVGGCCSSFFRSGFRFDCGAHSLGSFREEGQFSQVFKDLNFNEKIPVLRAEPSDTVLTDKYQVNFYSNVKRQIEETSKSFPSLADQIKNFFTDIQKYESSNTQQFIECYTKFQTLTFADYLTSYFGNSDIKDVFCVLLGNIGLPSHKISALAGITLFKEFVMDGGYYVTGGMQKFVDFFASQFKTRGGKILLKSNVEKICVSNGRVTGVKISSGETFYGKNVISSGSPQQTFDRMLSSEALPKNLLEKTKELKRSMSVVLVHLGLRGPLDYPKEWGRTVWLCPKNNANEVFQNVYENGIDDKIDVLLIAFPSRYDKTIVPENHESIYCFVAASDRDPKYWAESKGKYLDLILNRLSTVLPNVRSKLVVGEVASPQTVLKYTLNDGGAMYGLSSTIDQTKFGIMPQTTCIEGLFLASHWSTVGVSYGGTPMAAYAGRNAARLVLGKKIK